MSSHSISAHAANSAVALTARAQEDLDYWEKKAAAAVLDPNEASPDELALEVAIDEALQGVSPETMDVIAPGTRTIEVDVFIRPAGIPVRKEFLVVRVDGVIHSYGVISSSASFNGVSRSVTYPLQYTLNNARNLQYPGQNKSDGPRLLSELASTAGRKPWPWKRSITYAGSPMHWGLPFDYYKGLWMHATPHYAQLGSPASKGCVRMSYPTAMEVFDLVVNQAIGGKAKLNLHYGAAAASAFKKLGLESGKVNDEIDADLADAAAMLKPGQRDYHGVGHARRTQPGSFPQCQDVDCFTYFGVTKPDSQARASLVESLRVRWPVQATAVLAAPTSVSRVMIQDTKDQTGKRSRLPKRSSHERD